eukprot:Nk52_evm24s272 gene=Nk52_evmTU24s272
MGTMTMDGGDSSDKQAQKKPAGAAHIAGNSTAEKTSIVIENRIGKKYKITSDDRGRDAVVFRDCRKCEFILDFEFSDGMSHAEGNKRWMRLKEEEARKRWEDANTPQGEINTRGDSDESKDTKTSGSKVRPLDKQIFYFINCEQCMIKERLSLEAQFIFIDCKGCGVNILNARESCELVSCTDMEVNGVMLTEYRVFKCEGRIRLTVNDVCVVREQLCAEGVISCDRKWDTKAYLKSGKAMELVKLASEHSLD